MNAKKILLALSLVLIFGRVHALDARDIRESPENMLKYDVFLTDKGPAPTIMLGHGCSGPVKVKEVDYTAALNSWGYNVVIVDSWGPRGIKTTCKGTQPWYSPEDRMPEFLTIAKRIQKEPWHSGKIGYVGWSHGGSLGLNLANLKNSPFAAVVSYYPNCAYRMVPRREVVTKILLQLGEADTWTPPKECNDIKGPVERAYYANAGHSFDVKIKSRVAFGEKLEYNYTADTQAKIALKRFLDEHLR